MTQGQNSTKTVFAYHSNTKHQLHRYAASLGYLDWATQPNPFRTFDGAEQIELPLRAERLATAYRDLYVPGAVQPASLERNGLAILFELALGLSAWKEYQGTRWALRCNPSSGNLHPTEGYAICPEIPGIGAGVYHYVSRDHYLERRCVLAGRSAEQMADFLPTNSLLVGLSSIHWREAWKYGERAFRYCQHDMGHAIATIRLAAAALGWSARLLEDVSDSDVQAVLGLDRAGSFSTVADPDREHPGALLLVCSESPESCERTADLDIGGILDLLAAAPWAGQANPLSSSHVEWSAIDTVAEATWRGNVLARIPPEAAGCEESASQPDYAADSSPVAVQVIKQRRSCVALDGSTSISAERFYSILERLLPRPGVAPWDVWPWAPSLHCGVFVHRIQGLPSGLYMFERSPTVHENLVSGLDAGFRWKRPDGCPEHLRLFNLVEGDFRQQAQIVSCHQEIAAAGAFSLGMIAEFADRISEVGAWWYRRLFWESGLMGQVLYLEAEAAGVRGTGIGCYFDDVFHNLLGMNGNQFQSLYHFTVGGAVNDGRLMTEPGYSHLDRA